MSTHDIIKKVSVTNTTIPECTDACSFSGCCNCCCCCNSGQALCIAKSVCDSNIGASVPTSSVSVNIPGNSCITKIYASMPNPSTNVKYFLVEIEDGDSNKIFCHALPNTGTDDPVFDTTLVQPLCVKAPISSNDATITVTALNQNSSAVNEDLTLTVVFCPDCC